MGAESAASAAIRPSSHLLTYAVLCLCLVCSTSPDSMAILRRSYGSLGSYCAVANPPAARLAVLDSCSQVAEVVEGSSGAAYKCLARIG
jgi:hypothetical protein